MITFLNRIVVFAGVLFAFLTSAKAETYKFVARLPLYSENSKLSAGTWVKCRVSEEGIYKVTFDQLRAMGFQHPEKVRVFGYGGNLLSESLNADYIDDLPEVSSYLGESYLLFYGVGTVKWVNKYGIDPFFFTKNPYSDYGYYFLSDVVGDRNEVRQLNPITSDPKDVLNTHLKNALIDPDIVNINEGGNDWYDEALAVGKSKTYSFYCPNMVEGDNGYFSAYWDSPSRNSSLTFSADTWSYSPKAELVSSKKYLPLPYGDYLKVTAKFSNSSSSSALGYVNYVKVSALCYNKLKSGFLSFCNVNGSADFGTYDVVVGNADPKTKVWNVTDPLNVFAYTTSLKNDTLSFRESADCYNRYVAFNESECRYLTVEPVGVVAKQNLHNFKGADLIILSPSVFTSYAKQIGELHAEYDGLSYLVVTPEAIYNEFSSGTPDPTAIRAFMKMLYDRANADPSLVKPRYLLLFGDGSYDNRGLSGNVNNFLPTYQHGSGEQNAMTDDYYVALGDGLANTSSSGLKGSNLQVAVGRLPVSNFNQASDVVSKIARYMRNEEWGSWKSKVLMVADDDEARTDVSSFIQSAENTSEHILTTSQSALVKKVYLDNYKLMLEAGGRRYPEVENTIMNELTDGVLFFCYYGHSNPINLASEKIFTQSQVASLNNKKLGLWFTGSCSFGRFDGNVTSCAESLVLSPNGGAITVFAPTRDATYGDGATNGIELTKALFSGAYGKTFGDVVLASKQESNAVTFNLLGDPALRINLPQVKVYTDSLSADTLTALSHVTLYGHVSDGEHLMANFNGRMKVRVFDKLQSCLTKGNTDVPAEYTDYASTLFSGDVDVVNGRFACQFIIPKDIVYSYGFGRISCYAYDTENNIDAEGGTEVVIGGSSDNVLPDTLGPVIRLAINHASFCSGDVVGANPVLIAYLNDENGVNASGVGLGHDLSISLNGSDPVSVNDCFNYGHNSSSNGYVSYRLGALADGVYTLRFKAWDLLNNSSTQTISFVVDNSKGEHVSGVRAFPNPAVTETQVVVDYGHPLEKVDYRANIYSLQGVLVNSIVGAENTADGKLLLDWNLTDFNGSRVAPGVYVFRVDVGSDNDSLSGKAEKIVVLPQ